MLVLNVLMVIIYRIHLNVELLALNSFIKMIIQILVIHVTMGVSYA